MPSRRTPLAWNNLTHDRRRLAVAVGGILFAVVLMFMEVGFMFALFDSTVKILDDVHADIVLISPARYALPAEKRIPAVRLYQAQSCPGVAAVHPLYIERAAAALYPSPSGKGYPIRVIGYSLKPGIFKAPSVDGQAEKLRQPDTGLIDMKSKRPHFNFALDGLKNSDRVDAELSGRRIHLVGSFLSGTDFANDGNLILSDRNFAKYFPWRGDGQPLDIVDLGLVQLEPDADAEIVRRQLEDLLGEEVEVLPTGDYRAREIQFWRQNTPIGLVFQMGVLLGFIVGIIICYQVIYTDVADHMAEFATLKAIGYTHGFFVRLVIAESLWLSVFGFLPGLLVAAGLYFCLAQATGLLMLITVPRSVIVLLLTMAMCMASGLLALRKLLSADPAELF
ncbi:MAG: ABC transporter [Pirellulales bacterium]|nr:ABC transporter [Pirellulales bacterium]